MRGGPQVRSEYRIADPDIRWSFSASTPETRYNTSFPQEPVLGMLLSGSAARAYAAGERVRQPIATAPVTAAPNPQVPYVLREGASRAYHGSSTAMRPS